MRRMIATKNSIFKIHSLMYFVTIYYISQVNNDICMIKTMVNLRNAKCYVSYYQFGIQKLQVLSFRPC